MFLYPIFIFKYLPYDYMCVIPLRLNNVGEYSAVGNNVIKVAPFRLRLYPWFQLEYIS